MRVSHVGFHKDVFKPSLLKSTAVFLVFVFAWTNMGIFQAVYAATTNNIPRPVANKSLSIPSPVTGNRAVQLESLVKRIREGAEKVESKVQQTGIESEQAGFQKEKSELEQADVTIRAQFRQTEQRIKGLPSIIQQRQKAFERKYEKNFAQLKSELDSINTAKTNSEFTVRTRRLKAFLDKIKPPPRHIKLNPNKLPHRIAKPVWREPRMHYGRQHPVASSEENEDEIPLSPPLLKGEQIPLFEKEGVGEISNPIQLASLEDSSQYRAASSEGNNTYSVIPVKTGIQSPVRVAALGSLNGILSSAIVQTIPPPTAADLTSTVEVQFTPAILAKAAELNHNPVQIYNWVYNNIEYVPTYGSIQGADMCLQTMQCNDMDTASLLIALFRASNIPARYVYGTIQLPINQIMNWVGGFTDPMSSLELMASGGIPITGEVAGGKIVGAKIEHVWVDAYVPYGPSRGASAFGIKTWIPLDASYKQYTYKKGLDVQQITGFDPQGFINQITSTATIDPTTGSVTNIFTSTVQSQLDAIKATLSTYINTNIPNATVGDVIGEKDIVQNNDDILPATLPYTIIAIGDEFDQVSDNLRYNISITVEDASGLATPLTYTTSLPEIAEKRITLGYMPATQADAQVLNTYGYYNTPLYLVNLHPVLYIDGSEVSTGGSIGMGQDETLTITFSPPNGSSDDVVHSIIASTYADIGIDPQIIPKQMLDASTARFQQAVNQLGKTDVNTDDIVGEMLNLHSLTYFYQVDATNRIIAHGDIAYTMEPAEALATLSPNINYFFGSPMSIANLGMMLDVKRYVMQPASLTGDQSKVTTFMLNTGTYASMFECAIFDELHQNGAGISAVKILTLANQEGIPIYSIDSSNISNILSRLQVSSDVLGNIQNAVNSGEKVIIPQKNIQYNDWNGIGYIVTDPTTGASAFEISGGLSGSGNTQKSDPLVDFLNGTFDGSSLDLLKAILKFASVSTDIINQALKIAGPIAAAVTGIITGMEIAHETHSVWKGIAAGLTDFILGFVSGYLAMIVLGAAFELSAAIIGILIATVVVQIFEQMVLYLIVNAFLYYDYREQRYAVERWNTGHCLC